MSCTIHHPVKKLLFCCDLDSESILVLIAFVTFYMALFHLTNWIAFFCYLIWIPFLVSMIAYFVGSFFLFVGTATCTHGLIKIFPWIMVLGLIANIVYVVMLYVNQKCVADNVKWATSYRSAYIFLLFFEYSFMGIMPGINFVVTLYLIIFVADYLSEGTED